jgi:hypothetical protein
MPDPTFFRYCQEMLERYRGDKRVGTISGDNFQFAQRYGKDSYYFSKYVHVWGWASWRDRWQDSYDVAIQNWPRVRDEGRVADMVGNHREAEYWKKVFERVHQGQIDTWDYQWVFANWLNGRANILPAVNLISNIGFDQNATHTTGESELANMATQSLQFPLVHPVGLFKNMRADDFSEKKCFRVPLWKRVRSKLLAWVRRK